MFLEFDGPDDGRAKVNQLASSISPHAFDIGSNGDTMG